MITQLSQDSVAEYASDAQTIDEPLGTDYSQGVRVGRTIPAKWWNWLFSAVTKRAGQSKSDAQNMLTELQNVVTDAGIPLDASDNTQLSQAIDAKTEAQITDYVDKKRRFISLWYKINTTGLLPVPTGGNNWHWSLEPQKLDDFYWSAHTTYGLSSGNVYSKVNRVAFSKDLTTWRLFDPSTVVAALGSSVNFSAGVVKFQGYYYMIISSVGSGSGSYSYYAILKSEDTETWEEVVQYQNVISTVDDTVGSCIFIIGSTLYCFGGSRMYYTSDGDTWNYTGTAGFTAAYNTVRNCVCTPITFGTKTVVGGVYVEGTTLTKIDSSSANKGYLTDAVYKLKQGNLVNATRKYTLDNSLNVTAFTAEQVMKTVKDKQYLIIRKTISQCSFSEDGITFTDMPVTPEIFYPMCELNGKFFFSAPSGTYKIYVSTDLINWTDTGNVAVNNIAISSLAVANALVSDTKYSLDEGVNWLQAKDNEGNNFCGKSIFDIVGNNFYTLTYPYVPSGSGYVQITQAYFSINAVNHVVGHTLYLQ